MLKAYVVFTLLLSKHSNIYDLMTEDQPKKVFMYGSQVSGQANETSDNQCFLELLEFEGNLYYLLKFSRSIKYRRYSMKYISTTVLAKGLEIKVKDLFQTLLEKEYIEKDKDSWSLTKKGVDAGGIVKSHHQYGSYIAWPDNMKDVLNNVGKVITATNLAEHFTISKLRSIRFYPNLDY
jgi:hypothetical protein